MCSSSQPQPTGQSTTVAELPEWAKPYAQETLAKGQALTAQPYQTYNAPRIQGFTPDQLAAQQQAREMGPASQLGTATGLASAVGLGAMGTQYQPGQFQNQFQAPGQYTPSQFAMLQAQAPELTQYQMGGPERVRTGSFTRPGTAEAYMSPYIEQAIAPQLREAQRASDIAGTQMAGQATQAGAFGGSRFGLMEAERQRNLATQMGDIRARGLQSAYEQAQNLYGTEQQRALQAALANQQAGLTAGGQNLQALLGVQSLGAQQNLQAQLANQQMLQSAQQAAEQSRQFGAGQGLQAAGLGAQYGQAAEQLGEQSRQFGANLGMQGLTTGLQAAGQLGQLGQTQYGQEMGINQLLNQYGTQQQALQQQGLSQAYQDFLNQQNYPYKQLGFMSDLIRGLPLGQQGTKQVYEAPPTGLQQLGQFGLGAYGLKQLGMFADGGEVKTYAGDRGSVTSEEFVKSALDKLSDQQLAQAERVAVMTNDQQRLNDIAEEKAMRASEHRGLMGAYDTMLAARGGVVAFADRGAVVAPTTLEEALSMGYGREYEPEMSTEEQVKDVESRRTGLSSLYKQPRAIPMLEEIIQSQRGRVGEIEQTGKGLTALRMAAALGKSGVTSGERYGSMFGAAGEGALQAQKLKQEAESNLQKSQMLMAQAQDTYDMGLTDKAMALQKEATARKDKGVDQLRALDKSAITALGTKEVHAADAASREKIARDQIKQRAAEMNKPGEVERMLADFDDIMMGKKTHGGKTGLEGAEAYTESLSKIGAARYGVRHTGLDKGIEHKIKIDRLIQQDPLFEGIANEIMMTGSKTDAKSVARRTAAEEKLKALRKSYEDRYPEPKGAESTAGKPITKEAYDKLPSGAQFVAPDGSVRIKP